MKISRNLVIVLVFLVCALLMVVAALQLTHGSGDHHWDGLQVLNTSTPTLTLFPANGWWTTLPTSWAQVPAPVPALPTQTPASHP
ncbi:MAG: hypothetical protein WCE68_00345 [Anaerolineales bacterium]